MKIRFPQYEITLCVKIDDVFKVISHKTNARFTFSYAKQYYKDTAHWEDGWQDVKVISVDKAGTTEFDIPTNDLFDLLTNYKESEVNE